MIGTPAAAHTCTSRTCTAQHSTLGTALPPPEAPPGLAWQRGQPECECRAQTQQHSSAQGMQCVEAVTTVLVTSSQRQQSVQECA